MTDFADPPPINGYTIPPQPAPISSLSLDKARVVAHQAWGMSVILERALGVIAERAENHRTRALVEEKRGREFYLRASECADIAQILAKLSGSTKRVLRDTLAAHPDLEAELGIKVGAPGQAKETQPDGRPNADASAEVRAKPT